MNAAGIHPLAGQPAPRSLLVDVARLVRAYYAEHPDPSVAEQRVVFGTSGHRGSSLRVGFNEDHVLAITQAICLAPLARSSPAAFAGNSSAASSREPIRSKGRCGDGRGLSRGIPVVTVVVRPRRS